MQTDTHANQKPARLTELDALRVLAMIGVILIHVTAPFITHESGFTLLGMNLAYLVNQLTRFSVPLFFLLSGFSLGIGGAPKSYGGFLKKRCSKILLPYVVWVILYQLWNCSKDVALWLTQIQDLKWFALELLTGRAAPHLYFVPIIFQCYLLFPLLKRWVDRAPGPCFLWSLTVTLLLQGVHSLQSLGMLASSPSRWLWLTFPMWCFYFITGLFLQRLDFETIRRLCRENALPLVVLCGLFSLLFCAWSKFTGLLDSMKPDIMLYTLLVFLFGVAAWQFLMRIPGLEPVIRFLSDHSLGIYFNHVLVLCHLRLIPRFSVGMSGMVMIFLATFCVSVLVAVLLSAFQKLIKRILTR